MCKIYMLLGMVGFLYGNCCGSLSLPSASNASAAAASQQVAMKSASAASSVDYLDDYKELEPAQGKDINIYPIPECPTQAGLFDPGQSCQKTLQDVRNYIFPRLSEIVNDKVLDVARTFGRNVTTSVGTLVDFKAMQGDSTMSVAQLIQSGKLGAAIEHLQVSKAEESYEQKAYKEMQKTLSELREHDDSMQCALWALHAKKIQKNRELLTNLFLMIEALDIKIFQDIRDQSSGCGSWIELLADAKKVLSSMHHSNVIFSDRVSQEITSFNALAEEIGPKLQRLEVKMKEHPSALAAAASILEQTVKR